MRLPVWPSSYNTNTPTQDTYAVHLRVCAQRDGNPIEIYIYNHTSKVFGTLVHQARYPLQHFTPYDITHDHIRYGGRYYLLDK